MSKTCVRYEKYDFSFQICTFHRFIDSYVSGKSFSVRVNVEKLSKIHLDSPLETSYSYAAKKWTDPQL